MALADTAEPVYYGEGKCCVTPNVTIDRKSPTCLAQQATRLPKKTALSFGSTLICMIIYLPDGP